MTERSKSYCIYKTLFNFKEKKTAIQYNTDVKIEKNKLIKIEFWTYQSSKDALDWHEEHGAGTLLGDLPGSVSDWVLSLQREEEDGREVVHLCNARFPATDRLKKVEIM